MTAETAAPRPASGRRPFGIVVLAGLFLVRAAFLAIALAAPVVPELGPFGRVLALPTMIADQIQQYPAAGAILAAIMGLNVATAILLWLGRRTGWRIGILVTGLFLLVDLYQASLGNLFPLWTILDVVVVFYLNQQDVRDRFAVGDGGEPT
jgi:hypothetical protein